MRTIIWDVDDVLNNLMECWVENYWNPAHPDGLIDYEDLIENPPHRPLKISEKEYLCGLDQFRAKADQLMEPRWIILDWLWRFGYRYRHVALTSRPLHDAASASAWVVENMGEYIRTFSVVPSRVDPGTPQYDRDKAGFLRWFGHDTILIDDSLENVGSARRFGIRAVLFPQPWNGATESPEQALARLTAQAESA